MVRLAKRLAGLTAIVAVFSISAPATALATDEATCQFKNLRGTFWPPISSLSTLSGASSRSAASLSGIYEFAGAGSCVLVDNDPEDSAASGAVYGVWIASTEGWYTSSLGCGEITLENPFPTAFEVYSYYGDARFEGPFYSPLVLNSVGTRAVIQLPEVQNQERTGGSGVGTGSLLLTDGNCITSDAPAFSLSGAISMSV